MIYDSLFHQTLTKIPGTTKEEIGLAIESLIYIIDTTVKNAVKDMATKADIRDMATKADIRDMATKADIRDIELKMATKADIKDIELRMATKADIKDMATKADIKDVELKISQMETKLFRRMFGMIMATTLLNVSIVSLILQLPF